VARELRRLFRREGLTACTVQEFATQHARVADLLPPHLVVYGFPDGGVSARDSAVVVDVRRAERLGLWVGGLALHVLEGRGWERAPRNRHKGLHNHRSAVSLRVGPPRVMALHMPPGPHAWRLRGLAWRTARRTVESWAAGVTAKGVAWLVPGDWNKTRAARAVKRMARRLGASTRGAGIDWVMAGPGVRIVRHWKVRDPFYRADHAPTVTVVEVDR
jgi:plasmid stabilization system protein ParE